MYKSEVPKVLKRGDTIALISISGGRAGDEDMLYRYEAGKRRLCQWEQWSKLIAVV